MRVPPNREPPMPMDLPPRPLGCARLRRAVVVLIPLLLLGARAAAQTEPLPGSRAAGAVATAQLPECALKPDAKILFWGVRRGCDFDHEVERQTVDYLRTIRPSSRIELVHPPSHGAAASCIGEECAAWLAAQPGCQGALDDAVLIGGQLEEGLACKDVGASAGCQERLISRLRLWRYDPSLAGSGGEQKRPARVLYVDPPLCQGGLCGRHNYLSQDKETTVPQTIAWQLTSMLGPSCGGNGMIFYSIHSTGRPPALDRAELIPPYAQCKPAPAPAAPAAPARQPDALRDHGYERIFLAISAGSFKQLQILLPAAARAVSREGRRIDAELLTLRDDKPLSEQAPSLRSKVAQALAARGAPAGAQPPRYLLIAIRLVPPSGAAAGGQAESQTALLGVLSEAIAPPGASPGTEPGAPAPLSITTHPCAELDLANVGAAAQPLTKCLAARIRQAVREGGVALVPPPAAPEPKAATPPALDASTLWWCKAFAPSRCDTGVGAKSAETTAGPSGRLRAVQGLLTAGTIAAATAVIALGAANESPVSPHQKGYLISGFAVSLGALAVIGVPTAVSWTLDDRPVRPKSDLTCPYVSAGGK